MEPRYFSESGEWTCPKCGFEAQGPKCGRCRFRIYAGFWPRVFSVLTDKGVLSLMGILFSFSRTFSKTHFWIVTVSGYVLYLVYFVALVALWGQTPGKALLKIKVVDLKGAPVGWGRAFLRNLAEAGLTFWFMVLELQTISRIPMDQFVAVEVPQRGHFIYQHLPETTFWINLILAVYVYSEFIVIFLNKKKRAIHDFIAGTLIIHDPRLPFFPWKNQNGIGKQT